MGRAGPSGSARPSPGSPPAARGSRRARSRSSATGRSPSPSSTGRRPSPRTRTCSSCRCRTRAPCRRWWRRRRSASRPPPRREASTAATSRAVRALVSVSRVVNVLLLTMNSVSAGSRSIVASRMSTPSTFDTNRNVRARSEYWRRASVAIAGPRSEPPMPMLITFRIGLPVKPGPLVVADAHRERGHPIEDRVDVGDDVLAVDDQPLARGRRRAVCRTARSSVVLMRSPANIAARRSSTPAARATCTGARSCPGSPDASSSRGRSPRLRPSSGPPGPGPRRTGRAGGRPAAWRGGARGPATRASCRSASGRGSWPRSVYRAGAAGTLVAAVVRATPARRMDGLACLFGLAR